MTDDELMVSVVADALACVYSGASEIEAQALIDHLTDSGLQIVFLSEDEG